MNKPIILSNNGKRPDPLRYVDRAAFPLLDVMTATDLPMSSYLYTLKVYKVLGFTLFARQHRA